MLFDWNFWTKVALLLLISPGITTSAGPCFDAFVYVIGRYIVESAAAFAFCEVLVPAVGEPLDSEPQVGWACAVPAAAMPPRMRAARPTRSVLMGDTSARSSYYGCSGAPASAIRGALTCWPSPMRRCRRSGSNRCTASTRLRPPAR